MRCPPYETDVISLPFISCNETILKYPVLRLCWRNGLGASGKLGVDRKTNLNFLALVREIAKRKRAMVFRSIHSGYASVK